MEKNNLITVLLVLIAGLVGGYMFGMNSVQNQMSDTHSEAEKDNNYSKHDEEIISRDGAMMHAMEEMMMEFRGKTGLEYEEAFLEGMIVHHIGAIKMAEELLTQTERPELVKMANDIINVQAEEVEMMKGWLNEWFK